MRTSIRYLKRSRWLGAAFVVPMLGFTTPVAYAQGGTQIHACYVPEVGAMYRIKESGLPQACLDVSHVEFSWGAYTDADAVAAMGPLDHENPLHHNRYTDAAALAAMGELGNANPANHNRYTDAEAIAAVGTLEIVTRLKLPLPLEPGMFLTETVDCEPGELAVSGGWGFDNPTFGTRGFKVIQSAAADEDTWLFTFYNDNTGLLENPITLHPWMHVRCLRMSP